MRNLYPDFKRSCSKQIDALFYLEKPDGGWCVYGNETDNFVSIGHGSDFKIAVDSLNSTDPLDEITPPPSLEELDKDSALEYKNRASFLAVFEATTKTKWYLDKAEQLELQLAYLGLKVLIRQDNAILKDSEEQKRAKLADVLPRLVAFAGFSSCDSYENVKVPLNNVIKKDKFPLLSILLEHGRLIYCYTESIGGELMQLRAAMIEKTQNDMQLQATLKELAQKINEVFESVIRNKKT